MYEKEELEIIRKHVSEPCHILDIGANVGNHAIFFAKILHAKSVCVFEANSHACELLKLNVFLNGLHHVVSLGYIGIGLGSDSGISTIKYPQKNNIGAARLAPATQGGEDGAEASSVSVLPLDKLNIRIEPGFIKIDVEGMEIEVLEGASGLISCYKPKIFIEVDQANDAMFMEWVAQNDYIIVDEFKRYYSNKNYMILHRHAL